MDNNQNLSKEPHLLIEAALAYAKRGWPVFPVYESQAGNCACGKTDCGSPGKHPRTANGLKDAVTEENLIRQWWQEWPSANIGIRTGHKSGLCVLDIDKKSGGLTSFDQLEKLYGELPLGPVAFTGGGGMHFYFNYPVSLQIKNRPMALGKKFPGIDVRADGGYVIAPPSSHQSGECYAWEALRELPDVPACLIKLLTADGERAERVTSDIIIEGTRNSTLASIAGKYHAQGFSQEVIIEKLRADNERLCQPPLSEGEVIGIAKNISRYPRPSADIYIKNGGRDVPQIDWQLLSEIECKEITWLWPDFIAAGKLTLIVGDPGLGKSWVSLYIAAKVSTGAPWPNLFRSQEPGSVIIISAEDSPDDTIRPRFEACGGNSVKVIFLKGMRDAEGVNYFLDFKQHLHRVEELIQSFRDVKLMIVDPLVAYLGATDTHIDAKVRTVLGPLTAMAEKYGVALLGICHLNKSQQKNLLYKPGGSIAFVAAARSIMLVTYNPKDLESRLFYTIKSNITQHKFGLSFSIKNDRVFFDHDEIILTAEELQKACCPKKDSPAVDRCVKWVMEYIENHPLPLKSSIIEEVAIKAGHSKYALGRAYTVLGIKRRKIGNNEDGYWERYLPEEGDEDEGIDEKPLEPDSLKDIG